MRDKVRCPLCPRTLLAEDYRAHFDLCHATDLVSGVKRDYQQPKKTGAAHAEPRPPQPEPDDEATLPLE